MPAFVRAIVVATAMVLAGLCGAEAQTYFTTPGGSGVNGVVGMCTRIDGVTAVPCSDPTAAGGAVVGTYPYNVAGSVTTRPANTAAYTANSTVCAASCSPGTIALATTNKGKVAITRVTLLKSGSATTNASFTIWFFSAAPGLTSPTQNDGTAYTGPRAADMPNYIGNATCNTPVASSDTSAQVWYECALSNPNTAGALIGQALTGSLSINYLISVTAAYTPASGETFTPYVSGFY